MKKIVSVIILTIIGFIGQAQQLPPVFDAKRSAEAQSTETVRKYLSPVRILWKSPDAATNIVNAEKLLKQGDGQADLSGNDLCVLQSNEKGKPGLLLDFGKELHGGL